MFEAVCDISSCNVFFSSKAFAACRNLQSYQSRNLSYIKLSEPERVPSCGLPQQDKTCKVTKFTALSEKNCSVIETVSVEFSANA